MFGRCSEDLSRQDRKKVRTALDHKTEEAGNSCLSCFMPIPENIFGIL